MHVSKTSNESIYISHDIIRTTGDDINALVNINFERHVVSKNMSSNGLICDVMRRIMDKT